jgi:hypothetical protein
MFPQYLNYRETTPIAEFLVQTGILLVLELIVNVRKIDFGSLIFRAYFAADRSC